MCVTRARRFGKSITAKTADSAITQIKENRYARNLFAHAEEVLLVGINYDKKTKVHSCEIERIVRK